MQAISGARDASLNKPYDSKADFRQTLDHMFDAIFEHGQYADLVFRESNDPNSPAYPVVNESFDKVVSAMQMALPKIGNKKVDAIFLKSLLNANQWIAHDAIRKGLTPKNKQAAKDAAWILIERALQF